MSKLLGDVFDERLAESAYFDSIADLPGVLVVLRRPVLRVKLEQRSAQVFPFDDRQVCSTRIPEPLVCPIGFRFLVLSEPSRPDTAWRTPFISFVSLIFDRQNVVAKLVLLE